MTDDRDAGAVEDVADVADAPGWTMAVTGSASGGARFEFTNVT